MIARLFLHYWTPQELPEKARQAMAEDWVGDLEEFSAEVVSQACNDWRRSQTKRPTPAELRSRCIQVSNDAALPRLPAHGITNAEAELIADKWAQSHGFDNISHYQDETFEGTGAWLGHRYFPGRKKYQPTPIATKTAPSHGVTATEWKPTPEQMTEGRRALGFTDTETA